MFIHCSASNNPDHDDVSVIRRWHVEDRGWNDVGYHYFITSDGQLQKGRSLEAQPAAQYPYNEGTIAVCLHGLNAEDFTDEQYDVLRALCVAIAREIDVTFHGHCEVSDKRCPVFDYVSVLQLTAEGRLGVGK